MFSQFRPFQQGEFIIAFGDTAAGGGDNCAVQFLSHKWLDVPLVYHSKVTASFMTPLIHEKLTEIHKSTGVVPIVAFERNNGGGFEMDRLARLNRYGDYRIYTMKNINPTGRLVDTGKLGYDTNTATRPKMLADLKDAVESGLLHVYHRQTVDEMFSFIVSKTGKPEAEKGAHDDCFVKGTMILTDKGQQPIETIQVGDMVMTRDGFRPVIDIRSKRKKVIKRLGLVGTPDHPIITKRGDVSLDSVRDSDTLYIWNEKLSSIEERNTTDIPTLHADSTGSTSGVTVNGKNRLLHSTDRFIKIIMVKFQGMVLSIISTTTRSTITPLTSDSSQEVNMPSTTWVHPRDVSYQAKQVRSSQRESRRLSVSGRLITPRKQKKFIAGTGRTNPSVPSKLSKSGGQRTLRGLRKLLQRMATPLLSGYRSTTKRRVYNLQVAGKPEYFANSILVHNCVMSLAGAWQLYQTEQPKQEQGGGVVETAEHQYKEAGVLVVGDNYEY